MKHRREWEVKVERNQYQYGVEKNDITHAYIKIMFIHADNVLRSVHLKADTHKKTKCQWSSYTNS